MKKRMIRLLCAAGVLAAMACGAWAVTSPDGLVSLSYLNNTFLPSAVEKGTTAAYHKLQQTYDSAKATLDALAGKNTSGGSKQEESAVLAPKSWGEGDTVTLPTGSGALLLEGTVRVTHAGAVVDITAGGEVASGQTLKENHRYLVGEDTSAQLAVLSGGASMGVQGSYAFAKGGTAATPFYDVSSADWYYEPVRYVYEKALFSGMDDRHFAPNGVMNRAMLMTVLYRMGGSPSGQLQSADVSFRDVADAAWYAPYVKWAAAQKITAGTSPDTFAPEQQVTRQQVAVLLYSFAGNYLGKQTDQRADLSGYSDLSQASDWAREALSWAVGTGIMGSSSGDRLTLSPQKSASRAEVAAMLRAFSEKLA